MTADVWLEHLVVAPGERWDMLAYRYYGDANRVAPIIRANRSLFEPTLGPIPCILPIGLTLRIPVLAPDPVADALLPPWKRGAA
ncbi:MAG: tail protein X [Rhizobiales bacterium]|nr:tail protein X [Hyphomicrobiales bacterium]